MSLKTFAFTASALAGAFVVALAGAQAQDAPQNVIRLAQQTPPATPASIVAIYESRCKFCHEPAVDRAPSREALTQRSPDSIVEALTRGVMQPMAAGLSADEIRGLAVYLSGKPLAPPASATPPAAGARPPGSPNPALTPQGAPSGAQPADTLCATHPAIKAGASDWAGYGRDATNSRYQPNTSVTAANVGRLKVKWAFSLSQAGRAQPTIVGDHIFAAGGAGHVFSLDAKTGCVHWRANVGAPARTAPVVEHRVGASPSGWVVYVGDAQRNITALDAMTGKEVWKLNVEQHPRGILTGTPNLVGDRLYVPISSLEETIASIPNYSCCTFSGAVAAIDLKTHQIVWKTRMLPDPKPSRKNSAGTQMYGPAGAAIWSSPTVDVKRKQIYVATGDSYTEIVEKMSDAIVALDMDTGKIKWSNQVTQFDAFLVGCGGARGGLNCPLGTLGPDFDFGSSPIIKEVGGQGIVLAGQKSGVAYGFKADTGEMLWFDKIGEGSALGGIEWGMAASPTALYAGVADIGVPAAKARPGLNALDFKTGKTIWSVPSPKVTCGFSGRCANGFSAPPAASPGLVFAGSQDGRLRAFAAADGKILWDFDVAAQKYRTTNGVAEQPGGGIDASGPMVSGGMVYVMSGAQLAAGIGGLPVGVLLAFSVDGK
jgi:polyvinyl alcohol dehydrogenase (cytochrome)